MTTGYRRAAVLAFAITLAVILLTFARCAQAAQPAMPAACVTIADVDAAMRPRARLVSATAGGGDPQRISDALADHFNGQKVTVAAIVAYVNGGRVAVYGFGSDGCLAMIGAMMLDVYNAARAAAGLAPIVEPDAEPPDSNAI